MGAEVLAMWGQAPENSRLSRKERKLRLDEGLVENRWQFQNWRQLQRAVICVPSAAGGPNLCLHLLLALCPCSPAHLTALSSSDSQAPLKTR